MRTAARVRGDHFQSNRGTSCLPAKMRCKERRIASCVKDTLELSFAAAQRAAPYLRGRRRSGRMTLTRETFYSLVLDSLVGFVANGYVGAWIQSVPGSGGPTQSGVEHIAGVLCGLIESDAPLPKWPNNDCTSWCDRAHRADIPSVTSTAQISSFDSEVAEAAASAMDFKRGAYLRAYRSKNNNITCIQRTFAHRGNKFVLATEFDCTNAGSAPVSVRIREPGPSKILTRSGERIVSAPSASFSSAYPVRIERGM